jgi:hypothetical protein
MDDVEAHVTAFEVALEESMRRTWVLPLEDRGRGGWVRRGDILICRSWCALVPMSGPSS